MTTVVAHGEIRSHRRWSQRRYACSMSDPDGFADKEPVASSWGLGVVEANKESLPPEPVVQEQYKDFVDRLVAQVDSGALSESDAACAAMVAMDMYEAMFGHPPNLADPDWP